MKSLLILVGLYPDAGTIFLAEQDVSVEILELFHSLMESLLLSRY